MNSHRGLHRGTDGPRFYESDHRLLGLIWPLRPVWRAVAGLFVCHTTYPGLFWNFSIFVGCIIEDYKNHNFCWASKNSSYHLGIAVRER